MGIGFSKAVEEQAPPALGSETASVEALQKHFARELHDLVAQPLIGLVLDIHEAKLRHHLDDQVRADLDSIEESARNVLRQAREMLIDLRGRASLRINFVEAVKNELPVSQGHEFKLEVSARWPRRINGWAAFNLLRIVQQAVVNATSHGHARKIDILMDVNQSGEAVVIVLDDGRGVDGSIRGFGIVGMEERALILGGAFNISPREAGGTQVEVRVPVRRLE